MKLAELATALEAMGVIAERGYGQVDAETLAERLLERFPALAESSLSSPPPTKDDLSAPTLPAPLSTQLDTTKEKR